MINIFTAICSQTKGVLLNDCYWQCSWSARCDDDHDLCEQIWVQDDQSTLDSSEDVSDLTVVWTPLTFDRCHEDDLSLRCARSWPWNWWSVTRNHRDCWWKRLVTGASWNCPPRDFFVLTRTRRMQRSQGEDWLRPCWRTSRSCWSWSGTCWRCW